MSGLDDEELYDEFGNYIGPDLDDEEDGDGMQNGHMAGGFDNGHGGTGGMSAGGGAMEGDGRDEDDLSSASMDTSRGGAGAGAAQFSSEQDVSMSQAVVLPEDKKYYADAEDVFPEAEVLVHDEDTQPLEVPIIEPERQKKHAVRDTESSAQGASAFSNAFLLDMMHTPQFVRNVAVAGHLHHGKTTLLDMLVQQTHQAKNWAKTTNQRYTDATRLEQERGVSTKATPVSLVMQSTRHKSFLMTMIDTPGHVDFSDECTAAFRAADGVMLVVDAVEGVMSQTRRLIEHACAQGLPLVLCLAKLDRLILELKLPPADAYYKLRHTIDEVNQIVSEAPRPAGAARQVPLAPARGNVLFASAEHGWSFSLRSFAQFYARQQPRLMHQSTPGSVDQAARQLAARLWGDVYICRKTGQFSQGKPQATDSSSSTRARHDWSSQRTFVQFVLEPLYKVYSVVLSEPPERAAATLRSLGVHLKANELLMDTRPLLKLCLARMFGSARGLVDVCAEHLPSPVAGAARYVRTYYTGPQNTQVAQLMAQCRADGPLIMHVIKLYPSHDGDSFDAWARVLSGTVCAGMPVTVLGENYSLLDVEDQAAAMVTGVQVLQARYTVATRNPPHDRAGAPAGSMVLLQGVAESVVKTATVVAADLVQPDGGGPLGADSDDPVHIFRPLQFNTRAVVKLAVEPLNPSELPKMVDGLRKVNKSYPLLTTKVEESGEHVVLGTGELYLDSALHDLRRIFAEVEVKVADPVVSLCETVVETSSLKCFAETKNRKNKLTMIAEPLDKGLAEAIERGALADPGNGGGDGSGGAGGVPSGGPTKHQQRILRDQFGWDILAARSLWAFGPDAETGPNVLLNDTLPTECDPQLVAAARDSVVQGFQWGARDGPLCEEPIRNVKFRLLDATIASEPLQRGGGQLIPTARQVAYSAFLTAQPRLMEPIYAVEIQAPANCVSAVYNVLARRRGHVTSDAPKPGSPLYTVKGYLPVLDSFGFETDLRVFCQGQAFCMSTFDHFAIVPGDPLDKTIVLKPLEPSPPPHLARELCVKTRRRKGISEDVSVNRFFDQEMIMELAKIDMFV